MNDQELVERLERIERAAGLRPPEFLLPSGWDTAGHYWGSWVDPYAPAAEGGGEA